MGFTRRMVLALAVISALAGVAPAQTIREPNALVVYFDEAATQRSWYGTGPVTAYIVAGPLEYWDGAHNIPYHDLYAWAANLLLFPNEHVSNIVVRPRGSAWPESISIPGPLWWVEMEVQLDPSLPLSGLTVIADIDILVLSDQSTEIHVQGTRFVADDGQTRFFAELTNGPDGPMDFTDHVANINAEAPVLVDATTWGGLKALFD